MITRFYNEQGYSILYTTKLDINYAIAYINYAPNPRYFTRSKTYGFKTEEDAAIGLGKRLSNYEYEFNEKGIQTYCKNKENGDWFRKEYDSLGNWISFETSKGVFWKLTYDNIVMTSYVDSEGNWWDKDILCTYKQPPYTPPRIGNGPQLYFPEIPIHGQQLKLPLDFT
jgi:hypothetical protein